MFQDTMHKKLINGFAVASLFIAFYIGQASNSKIKQLSRSDLFGTYRIDSVAEDESVLRAYSKNQFVGYLSTGTAQGYGGPLEVLVLTDSTGHVKATDLVHNTETYSYITKLNNNRYFDQYKKKASNDKYLIHEDISAISGATVSSNAIAIAGRHAAWKVAENKFALSLPDIGNTWKFGKVEILTILIFLLAILSAFWKKKVLRYVALFSSFVVLGFMYNASISLSHIGRLLLGYLPDIRQHFVWWLFLGGNIMLIVFLGRNVYCSSACPFHAAQVLLHKISGMNLKIAPKLSHFLVKTPKLLLWLSLMLILVSKNPTLVSYEPFAMFFSLEGIGIQWYILPAALVGSLFVSNFFCRFFCPVGASFNVLLSYRRGIVKRINTRNGKE